LSGTNYSEKENEASNKRKNEMLNTKNAKKEWKEVLFSCNLTNHKVIYRANFNRNVRLGRGDTKVVVCRGKSRGSHGRKFLIIDMGRGGGFEGEFGKWKEVMRFGK
jgi:hypothetical protein